MDKITFWCVVATNKKDQSRTILIRYAEDSHGLCGSLVMKAARNEGFKGTLKQRLADLNWEIRQFEATPKVTDK